MTAAWSSQHTTNFGSTEVNFFAIPGTDTVLVGYYDGAGNAKVQKSSDGGNTFAAAVTVDATVGTNDVMLNDPWAYDPVNNRLFLCYGRNIDSGSKALLCLRYSDDQGATWSAEHVIDDGTAHTGTNSFYRVGCWANNGVFSCHYTYESNSTFTTDGLWRTTGTYSSGGLVTWVAAAKAYTGTVIGAYEPNAWGFSDGTVIVSYYDDGQNANKSGNIWIARSSDNGNTWGATPTKLTSTSDYGRPRIKGENGVWWIVANKPWNNSPSLADVYSLMSTDNGVTWGSPTLRISNNGNNTSHPDVAVQGTFVAIVANLISGGHQFVVSADGGSTFSAPTNPFGDASTSAAPRLLITNTYLLAVSYDTVNTRSMWVMNPYFTVLPQSQTAVIDNFNRANEDPLSGGGKWTQGSVDIGVTGDSLKVSSNAVIRHSAAGTFDRSGNYRNDATYTGNVEVFATIATAADGETDVCIGVPSTKNGYQAVFQNGTFGTNRSVRRYDAGVATVIGAATSDASQSGDIIAFQMIGTQVVSWRLRGGVLTELYRIVDNTYRASLALSLDIAGNTGAGDTVDDFGGGSLAAPVNTVAPTIGGASRLTVLNGTWSNAPSYYRYQWKKDGVVVAGAVLNFYNVQPSDVGHTFTCTVTATNVIGSTAVTTAGVVASSRRFSIAPTITPSIAPSITGGH